MRLKKVEIMGFKSFLERTCLTFDSRVTAIVGPNGCGKSNIVDAIRWAMGEPSAKALRGQGMEDVIFHGTESHDPIGMAEVTLTFENTDGQAPPYLAGCSEIEVTRRLFRSGESEYTINKVPCRRKDVWELFMDTGVGNRSFAIVEQDKVSKIISSKPEERRVLVEEIAGISRYKSRRETAQKKMEATTQNLLRIQDVRAEVWEQMKALERQAKRAIHFRNLKQELLELERKVALRRLSSLEFQRREIEERLSKVRVSVQSLASTLEEGETLRDEERLRLCEMEVQEANLIQELRDLERSIAELENRLQREDAEIRILTETLTGLSKEIDGLALSLARTKEKISQTQAKGDELLAELNLKKKRFHELESLKGKEVDRHRLLKTRIDGLRAEIVDLLSERARLRNSLSNYQRRREDIQRQRTRLQGEVSELKRKIQESLLKENGLAQQIKEEELALVALKSKKEENQKELDVASRSYQETLVSLRNLEEQGNEIRSTMEALVRLQRELAGFQEGIRRLREAASKGELVPMEGQPPVLAELLSLAPGSSPSFLSLLGERLEWLVVGEWEHAISVLRYARENNLGRIGVFVANGKPAEPMEFPTERPRCLPFVLWEPGYECLGEMLFQDLEVVSDLDEARERLAKGSLVPMITPQGEFIDPRGLAEGGERCDGSMAFMRRKEEIRQLSQTLAGLEIHRKELAAREEELRSHIASLSSQRDNLQDLCHKNELKLAELRKDLASLVQQRAALDRRCEALNWQIEELVREEEETTKAHDEDSRLLGEVEKHITQLQGELERLQQDHESLSQGIEALGSQITSLQVEVASLEEKMRSIRRELKELESKERGLVEGLSSRDRKREEIEKRIYQLSRSVEHSKDRLAQLVPRREELRQRFEQLRSNIEERRLKVSNLEASLHFTERELREKEAQLAELRLEHKEILLRVEHARGELKGRLEIPEGVLECRLNDPVDTSPEEDDARIQTLREQLGKLGEVNLGAPEQYDELKARWEALGAQQEDLERSIRSLKRAIQRIDRSSRRRFKEAFEKLDAQFRKVFPILFEGGQAHLVLTQAEDVLESGVDIVAKPPGKKLQNISLLSGGEKVLTAVALVFAMLMVKETPFCLLDEVDAPLDEANVERFANMVKQLSDRSQFILVTHSKRTMEMADLLYGVTMETPGVSKTVSVKLH